MGSILAKQKLPIEYINNLNRDFGERIADKILEGYLVKRKSSFRVNTLKSSISEIQEQLDRLGISYERVDWYNKAFIIDKSFEKKLRDTDEYKNGKIYFQSLSSMMPVVALNLNEGESILDVASAPGSKTTQIATETNNKSKIIANEKDTIRIEKLKHNADLQSAKVEIINYDGVRLGELYKEEFDKVLLDTPCSGEGRFIISEKETYSAWSNKLVLNLSELQKELIKSAAISLKPGGEMIYSTCTLNKKEDEEIVNYAIKNLGLEEVKIDIDENNKNNKLKLIKSEYGIKVMPNEYYEGFYIVKLRKVK